MSKLRVLLESLTAQEPLAVRHRDHPLRGIWKGHREAHIEPDWLVIYYAVLPRGGDRWGSPNFGREPPYHHAGHVEFVQLDECRRSLRAEGVRHRGRLGRVSADVLPIGSHNIDRAAGAPPSPPWRPMLAAKPPANTAPPRGSACIARELEQGGFAC